MLSAAMNRHSNYSRDPISAWLRGDPLPVVWTFRGWMQAVESALIGYSCRATLSHISAEQWRARFDAGDSPEDAVLSELVNVAD